MVPWPPVGGSGQGHPTHGRPAPANTCTAQRPRRPQCTAPPKVEAGPARAGPWAPVAARVRWPQGRPRRGALRREGRTAVSTAETPPRQAQPPSSSPSWYLSVPGVGSWGTLREPRVAQAQAAAPAQATAKSRTPLRANRQRARFLVVAALPSRTSAQAHTQLAPVPSGFPRDATPISTKGGTRSICMRARSSSVPKLARFLIYVVFF